MTQFYFHTWRDDRRSADETGLDLSHQAQARDLAARDLGEMARDLLHASPKDVVLGIDIADADGRLLARLRLAYTLKPGT
jgi:hypothetical protein